MTQHCAVIIKNQDGHFLLHLRDDKAPRMKNEWCLIGGSSEDQESAEEAVRREVLEETALAIQNLKFYQAFTNRDTGRNITIFTAVTDTRDQTMVLGEGAKLCFFSKDDTLDLLASIPNKNQYLQILEEFLKKTNSLGE